MDNIVKNKPLYSRLNLYTPSKNSSIIEPIVIPKPIDNINESLAKLDRLFYSNFLPSIIHTEKLEIEQKLLLINEFKYPNTYFHKESDNLLLRTKRAQPGITNNICKMKIDNTEKAECLFKNFNKKLSELSSKFIIYKAKGNTSDEFQLIYVNKLNQTISHIFKFNSQAKQLYSYEHFIDNELLFTNKQIDEFTRRDINNRLVLILKDIVYSGIQINEKRNS